MSNHLALPWLGVLNIGHHGQVLFPISHQVITSKIMKFRPLHDRVVIKRIEAEEKTSGGIIIPDTATAPLDAQT